MSDNSDTTEKRRRQARYRSWRRGIREMDFILGGYADEHLATLNDRELAQFEALLEVPDQDLYAWITGAQPVPDEFDNDIVSALKRRPVSPVGAQREGG